MIDWNISRKDLDTILLIVERVFTEFPNYPDDKRSLLMDLNACHTNGCPLDLAGLLTMPRLDFSHDIYGLRQHLNRETGKLEDFFVPRCAKADVEVAP
jgi:hypothetical protein